MNYPVVLVPGLLGSMGEDILPGTGDFDFGLAQFAYKPILDNFQKMGFRRDKDLFIAFYDWRMENQISAEKYLVPYINKVKKQTGSPKVNLVCHSMGGLVARAYIQSSFYRYDVDKLVMIGTPNAGAAKAYYFWEGGQIPSNEGFGNLFYNLLWEGFIWLYRLFNDLGDGITIKRELVPSIKELLPSKSYGDFLFTIDSNNYGNFIPYDEMIERNTFLDALNERASEIYRKGVKTYTIAGNGVKTEKFLRVIRDKNHLPEWVDGRPDHVVYTNKGDGTVTINSGAAIYGNITYIEGDHLEILKNSRDTLANILNRRIHNRKNSNNTNHKNSLCTILARNTKSIYLESMGRRVDTKDLINERPNGTIVSQIGNSISSITINLEETKNVKLIFIPKENVESDILVLKRSDTDVISERNEIKTKEIYVLEI